MFSLRRLILFSHLFLAGCAVALFAHTVLYTGGSLVISPCLISLFSSTIVYYNFHKFSYKIHSLRPLHIIRLLLDPSVYLLDRILFVAGSLAFVIAFFNMSFALEIAWLAVIGLSLLYTLPVVGPGPVKKRLREFPLFKPVIVALVWAITTVIFPHVEYSLELNPSQVFLLTGSCFVLVFVLCIPFEIRDEAKEQQRSVESLMRFGRKKILIATAMLVLFTLGIQTAYLYAGWIDGPAYRSLAIPLLIAAMWMLIAKPFWPGWFFKFAIDGTMLLPWLFLILSR